MFQRYRHPSVMTLQKWAYFFSLVFVAIIFVPAGAHLAELLNKIDLPRDQYFVVQGIYAGWALFGAPCSRRFCRCSCS